jgi:hypothetical protein
MDSLSTFRSRDAVRTAQCENCLVAWAREAFASTSWDPITCHIFRSSGVSILPAREAAEASDVQAQLEAQMGFREHRLMWEESGTTIKRYQSNVNARNLFGPSNITALSE